MVSEMTAFGVKYSSSVLKPVMTTLSPSGSVINMLSGDGSGCTAGAEAAACTPVSGGAAVSTAVCAPVCGSALFAAEPADDVRVF